MKSEQLSFVYFGSGPVAAENLRQLREHFRVEAVITKPTTEQEMRMACPDSPIYCVSSRAELDSLVKEHGFESRVGVLIDFGIIVSNTVIELFEKGIVNSHFSLLPQWRGADPITFSILSGQERTGVSLMLLVEAMDEGPIIGTGELVLHGDETTPSLTEKLVALSTSLIIANLEKFVHGDIEPATQSTVAQSLGMDPTPTYSRKLTKEDGLLDWSKSAGVLEREVRAYTGWPKSRTRLGTVDVIITKARAIDDNVQNTNIGLVQTNDARDLFVSCAEGSLHIIELKPAGKKEMDAKSFLAGYASRIGISYI